MSVVVVLVYVEDYNFPTVYSVMIMTMPARLCHNHHRRRRRNHRDRCRRDINNNIIDFNPFGKYLRLNVSTLICIHTDPLKYCV